jgi:hypothetical protein
MLGVGALVGFRALCDVAGKRETSSGDSEECLALGGGGQVLRQDDAGRRLLLVLGALDMLESLGDRA